MLYKVVKFLGKDVEERESLTRKKQTRIGIGDKKTTTRQNNESLRSSMHCGKNVDDPQVKLKQLGLSSRNSGQEMPAGEEQLIRHMRSIEGDKKYPLKNENPQGNGSCSAKNMGDNKNKSSQRLSRSNVASANKNSTERTKAQKGDFQKNVLGFKSNSHVSEFPKGKAVDEIVRTAVGGKKNGDLGKRSGKKEVEESSKKEIWKSVSDVEPVTKKSLRRSEIPVLKTRRNMEKGAEVVSLLMQKPVKENVRNTLVDLSQNMKDYTSGDEFTVTSELGVIFKSKENSPKIGDNGEVKNLRSATREILNTSKYSLTPSNVTFDSKTSEFTASEKKAAKASKAKTLDLERVKTSSFTILRAEGDSLNRLESFHQQNLTAKESARAEIAIKASKVVLNTEIPKASFSSITSKKNFLAPGCGDKGNKTKRTNEESQESNSQKKSQKAPEATYIDTEKEGKGKVGNLIPKRLGDEINNKNASADDMSLSSRSAAESWEKTDRNVITKKPLKERECSKKSKISQNPEEELNVKSSSETVGNKFADVSGDTLESPGVKTPESYVIERDSEDAARELEELRDEEVKLTPRELASLVVTGTALNFDNMEIFEKPPEVNKIKLEIKIDVPSEEDVTDSETVDGEMSKNASRASFDWLLVNKKQNHEPFPWDYKANREKVDSWKLLTEEFKTGEWKRNDEVLQKRRPHLTKTVISMSGVEKRRGSKLEERWSLPGDLYDCSTFFQSRKKRDAVSSAKVRNGLTRSCKRDEKIFDGQTSLKLRRRNSEPYSLRGFIWKRADIASLKSPKPSLSSEASSLRHLNTDDLDDFIFWEAVPQKLTSCWEMSLYHFKRPWSVLSFSVFKDNRQSNTPGLILNSLRGGGMQTVRRPLLYQNNDRVHCHAGNIFDIEPSISQKNIDIRNWLGALNFTAPIPNAPDAVSENTLTVPPALDTKKQIKSKRRNGAPQFKLQQKAFEKTLYDRVKNRKFDKWSISDAEDLKELIRKESGSFVTKELPGACAITDTYTSTSEKCILKEGENQNGGKEARSVKSVDTSCQAELSETRQQLKLKESPDMSSSSLASVPPEVNTWKYMFLFTLVLVIFYYFLGSNFVIRF